MQSFLSLAVRNSFRSRRRCVLTILNVAVSFCLLGVVLALYQLFFLTEAPPDQALRLVVRNRVSFAQPLPSSYADKIKTVAGVRAVMIQQWFGGTYKDSAPENNFARFAIEADKLFTFHPEYQIPNQVAETFLNRQDSCILSSDLADRLRLKRGDRITLRGDIFPASLNLIVAGFFQSVTDSGALYFHNQYLKESLRRDPGYTIMFEVLADRLESVNQVARGIDDLFRNAPLETRTETEKSYRLGFLRYVGNVKLFLYTVAAALAAMVLLVSLNTVAMSARERTQEIGIMRALGFSRASVIRLLAIEAILLAELGAAAGLTVAFMAVFFLRSVPVPMLNMTALSISPALLVWAVLLAGLCGLVAALPAAWKETSRPIVESIRQAD